MSFESILFQRAEDRSGNRPEQPGFFTDLNLDQIIEAVIKGREEYNLKPFFWSRKTKKRILPYSDLMFRAMAKDYIRIHMPE